jgi:hypothetical protein
MSHAESKHSTVAAFLFVLGATLGSLATIAISGYWEEHQLAEAIASQERITGSGFMPMACFVSGDSWYTGTMPDPLCVWVEDAHLPKGGCWKLKGKDLCWSDNDNGWYQYN